MIVRALVPPRDAMCDGCSTKLAYWSVRPEVPGGAALEVLAYVCTACLHEFEEALLVGANIRQGESA